MIASFDNRTGDSTLDAFGRIAADIITEQLARAGIVNVVDAATALANSQQVRGSTPLIDSPQALESLARTTHSRIVVTGSYFRDGDDLVAQARVTDAATNDVLAATEPVRGPVAQPDRLIHLLQQRVMGALALRLDERLATIVPAGNTPTYEAYQSFVAGFDMLMSGRFVKSAPYFDRAYALDTTFLESLIWEASALPPPAAAKTRAVVDILKRRRAELTQVQRYALDEREALLDDKLDVALAAARRAAELAPGSYWKLEIATLLFRLGRPQDAVDVWSTIDRDHGWPTRSPGLWMGYVWELHDAGLHREELARVREARARFPESDGFVRQEAIALAANHKWNELDQDIAALEHRSPVELAVLASELRVHSERDRANAIYDRLVRSYAAHVPTAMDAVDFQTQRAHALYNAGRWNEAERLLDSLDSDGRQPAYIRPLWVSWLALARARVGDRVRATAVLDSLVGDTASHNLGMRFSLARLAAVLGDRTRAMELLQSLRDLPGDWQHYDTDAADFDSLVGYPPYETLRGGR